MRPRLLVCLTLVPLLLAPWTCVRADEAPPLPERNPLRAGVQPKVERPLLPGEMPTVAWTEAEVTAAKAACSEALQGVPLDYEPLDPIKEGLCGAPAPILVKSIGSDPKVVIDPPATITCPLAHAVGDWLEHIVQPEAKALLGGPVTGLHNATSYACRNRYGAADTPLSEHALANALDVSEFVLADGKRITVLDAWPKVAATPPLPIPNPARPQSVPSTVASVSAAKSAGHNSVEVTKAKVEAGPPPSPPPVAVEPASDPKTDFVRHVHDAACRDFGTVLGPDANAAHKNHFHLDMKGRRSSFCE